MTGPDLKPCPFCGTTEMLRIVGASDGHGWGFVRCDYCDAEGPDPDNFPGGWNRRTPDPAVLDELPEVQALIAAAYEVAAHTAADRCAACGCREIASLVKEHVIRRTPADAIATREARDAQMRAEGRVAGLREGYLLGFMASGEIYNAEYPFRAMDINPESDDEWRNARDEAIRAALSAREGDDGEGKP